MIYDQDKFHKERRNSNLEHPWSVSEGAMKMLEMFKIYGHKHVFLSDYAKLLCIAESTARIHRKELIEKGYVTMYPKLYKKKVREKSKPVPRKYNVVKNYNPEIWLQKSLKFRHLYLLFDQTSQLHMQDI